MGRGKPQLNLTKQGEKMKEQIKEDYKNSNVLFELSADSAEIYIIETEPESEMFNEFVLIWGDYVANVWEEKYELLSQATARMAQLIHVLERDPQGEVVGFAKYDEDFTTAWATFIKETMVVVDYEGAK
jgi:ribosomal protein S18 acetylase RimI-like enzyme